MNRPPDILTIDVEEWFHGHNYLDRVPQSAWDRQDSRVERNTDLCLKLLADQGVRATFFILGWTAERHPALVERIAAAGHEIACHSYAHPVVFELSEDAFKADLEQALAALRLCGIERVGGFRAPSFTLTPPVHHYLSILASAGFDYDCSIYPVRHPRYGQPASPRHAFLSADGGVLELPMTTVRIFGQNLPFSGGGYLRLLPLSIYRVLRKMAGNQNQPVIIYLHPWELDDLRPDVGLDRISRLRSQGGQGSMRAKLERILDEGEFTTMGSYVDRLRLSGDVPVLDFPYSRL